MAWTDEAWEAISDIYKTILEGPFVKELGEGTLSEERFMEYMVQDRLYLAEYGRALSMIATRAPTSKDAEQWSKFSIETSIAETTLHDFYIKNFNVSEEMQRQLREGEKSPTCELYTSYLLKHATLSPLEVAAAAVLPCFWIYDKVGRHHLAVLKAHPLKEKHPFAKWVETYGGEEFGQETEIAKEFCDRLAANTTPEIRKRMTEAFVTASKCELLFWQAAYDNEKWPLSK